MKQTDESMIAQSREVMAELKEIRGGELLPFHRKLANDPQVLKAFMNDFVRCKRDDNVIPKKYRELMRMLLGCTRGVSTTILVHGKKAVAEGATIQEVGEALRLALLICGVSAVIPAAELFVELEEEAK